MSCHFFRMCNVRCPEFDISGVQNVSCQVSDVSYQVSRNVSCQMSRICHAMFRMCNVWCSECIVSGTQKLSYQMFRMCHVFGICHVRWLKCVVSGVRISHLSETLI